jgi:hypothetical protein
LAQQRPGWALGFADEVWFSRLAQPALHAWTAGETLRLGLHPSDRTDPEPKALACYGLWLPARARMLLRFGDGPPVSPVTCAFPAWVVEQLAADGVRQGAGLGQCLLAHQPGGPRLAAAAQPRRQGGGPRLSPAGLPAAEPEPVAERDRAEGGAWQACGGRAGTQAHRGRAAAAGL